MRRRHRKPGIGAAEAAHPCFALAIGRCGAGHGNGWPYRVVFPGGDRLEAALAPADGQMVEYLSAEAAGEPRITLTLPVLLAAEFLAVHVEGTAKRGVLEAARAAGPVARNADPRRAGAPAGAGYFLVRMKTSSRPFSKVSR